MKQIYILLIIIILTHSTQSQEFLWAESYDINNCNEVAAMAVDTNGYIFTTGVYDAPFNLPYTGNCYIQKTDQEGIMLWTEYITGEIQIGDMATVGSSIVIIGQSNGQFSYKDEQYGPLASYFMFVMKIDFAGNIEWFQSDESKYGANTNISVGKLGKIALHVRGQYNLGDWILIMDTEGNLINSKQLSATETLIIDMAYYDDRIYLNGGFNGSGSVLIDTIIIQQSPFENVTFVLALDQGLVAEWISKDTTINNRDGRIVASNDGIFVYQEVLEPPFSVINTIKKFSFEGQLLAEVNAPVFTNAVVLYPDMTISQNMVGLFAENAFDFNSHKLMLFDFNLNLISEKIIDGTSDLYSGQITSYEDDIFVAHVCSGDLNFNNELNLPYSGTGKRPYIAKIGNSGITQVNTKLSDERKLSVYPIPAKHYITIKNSNSELELTGFRIKDYQGITVMERNMDTNKATINISQLLPGIYIIEAILANGEILTEKLVIN